MRSSYAGFYAQTLLMAVSFSSLSHAESSPDAKPGQTKPDTASQEKSTRTKSPTHSEQLEPAAQDTGTQAKPPIIQAAQKPTTIGNSKDSILVNSEKSQPSSTQAYVPQITITSKCEGKTAPVTQPPYPPNAVPPMHDIVMQEYRRAQVELWDRNYIDEHIGVYKLDMEVAQTSYGQVYPLRVNLFWCPDETAGARLSTGANISAVSVKQKGRFYTDITFDIKVGGPNETETTAHGPKLEMKAAGEGVEVGASWAWNFSTATTRSTSVGWSRIFRITATEKGLNWKERVEARQDIKLGSFVVDDDTVNSDKGKFIQTDWNIESVGGEQAILIKQNQE